jgi:MarR family transcriptional regulator, organic hydroperoxide resistance regulator
MNKKRVYSDARDIRQEFWGLSHRVNDITTKYMDIIQTKETGLTYQQFLVLMVLDKTGNQGTVGTIAEQLDREQNTLSVLLERMKRDGLVKKVRNMGDRRLVRVVMTDKGKQKLAQATGIGNKLIAELTSSYTEEEMKIMMQLIRKMEKSADEQLAEFKTSNKRR